MVATQTCNLYNTDFVNIPRVELVGADEIERCDLALAKGDNPRLLHVNATSVDGSTIPLAIHIQSRQWSPRASLAELCAPSLFLRDPPHGSATHDDNDRYLDKFAGWLARSYTRVALPDEFNRILKRSKIEQVLKDKLGKRKNDLYGIYLNLSHASEELYDGVLGEMPDPYLLEITLVTSGAANPDEVRGRLIGQLFTDKIQDPDNRSETLTRAQLASRLGLRLLPEGIEAISQEEITLQQVRTLVRYTVVDHLSDSGAGDD